MGPSTAGPPAPIDRPRTCVSPPLTAATASLALSLTTAVSMAGPFRSRCCCPAPIATRTRGSQLACGAAAVRGRAAGRPPGGVLLHEVEPGPQAACTQVPPFPEARGQRWVSPRLRLSLKDATRRVSTVAVAATGQAVWRALRGSPSRHQVCGRFFARVHSASVPAVPSACPVQRHCRPQSPRAAPYKLLQASPRGSCWRTRSLQQ